MERDAGVDNVMSSYSKLNEIFAAANSSAGITAEQYAEIVAISPEFASALEYNGMGMSLNAEAANELATSMANSALAQLDLQEATDAARIAQLGTMDELTEAESAELDTLNKRITMYDILRSEIVTTTSAYQAWLNAQQSANEDVMSDAATGAFNHIKDVLYNQGSDVYQQTGTDDFKSAMGFLFGSADVKSDTFKNAYKTVEKWAADGYKGAKSYVDDLYSHGFLEAVIDDNGNKSYKSRDGLTIEEVAGEFGVTTDLIRAFTKNLSAYGADIKFDEQVQSIEELDAAVEKADSAVGDATGIEERAKASKALTEALINQADAIAKIVEAEGSLPEGTDIGSVEAGIQKQIDDLTVNGKAYIEAGVYVDQEAVNDEISKLEEQKAVLGEIKISESDSEELAGISAAISDIDAKLSSPRTLSIDTSEAQADLDSILTKLTAIERTSSVGLKSGEENPVGGAAQTVIPVVDANALGVIGAMLANITGQLSSTRVLSIDTSAASAKLSSILSQLASIKNSMAFGGVASVSGGAARAFGGSVGGRSMAGGSYRRIPSTDSGETLVGELGQEAVVDPHSGMWYTVGDTGAQFTQLPKDAIVFNHKQTEQLLKYGSINSRGRAASDGEGQERAFKTMVSPFYIAMPDNLVAPGGNTATGSSQKRVKLTKKLYDEEYKLLKHLLEINEISYEEYYKRLGALGDKYYDILHKDVNDWRSFLEEKLAGENELYGKRNESLEHYITLQEVAYDDARRILDYGGMDEAVKSQVSYYEDIMENASAQIDKIRKYLVEAGWSEEEIARNEYIQSATNDYREAYESRIEMLEKMYQDGADYYSNYIEQANQYGYREGDSERAAILRLMQYLDDSYHNGLISYEKYCEEKKSVTKDLYDAINTEIDDSEDRMKAYVDAALDVLKREKAALDKLKDGFNEEKESYETASSTVGDYIDKQIEALEDENDILDKQLEIQKALEEIDKAKAARTIRIFREGEGFVYEADAEKVREAQEAYDDLRRNYDFDAKKDALTKYKEMWEAAISAYQEERDAITTATILGENWGDSLQSVVELLMSSAAGGDPDVVQGIIDAQETGVSDFQAAYKRISDQLNEDVEGSVAYQLKKLDELETSINDYYDAIQVDYSEYAGLSEWIASFEAENLANRLTTIQSFCDSAIESIRSLKDAMKGVSTGEIATNNPEYPVGVPGFANGGVVSRTGLAMLHGGGSSGAELVLNNTDVSKLYDYIHSTPDLVSGMVRSASDMVSVSGAAGRVQMPTVTMSIGDIHLTGVQDVGGLAEAIRDRLPAAVMQLLYKR